MATLSGRNGNDILKAGAFADKLFGLGGNDLLFGNGGDDFIDGGTGNDKLYGGAGNDKLYGGAGNDLLDGGDGNDLLSDAVGLDIFNGGLGFDTVDYSAMIGGRGVDVFLSLGIGGRGAAGDHYTGIEGATGTNFQDFLWGDSADNTLNGLAGNDFLRGFGGDDTLIGGAGNDEMYGDGGNDTFRPGFGQDIMVGGAGTGDMVDYSDSASAITVDFGTNTFSGPLQQWGTADGDQVYSIEILKGTNFDDTLDLTNANIALGGSTDVFSFTELDGGKGDDKLSGALRMTGGEGEDKIILSAGLAQAVVLQYDRGYDKIVNFSDGTGADPVADKLEVSKAMFGLTGIAGSALPAANWVDDTNGIDSPDALTAQPTFIYEVSTSLLWFDADGTGTASAPVAIAGFYGSSVHPHASDIILVA